MCARYGVAYLGNFVKLCAVLLDNVVRGALRQIACEDANDTVLASSDDVARRSHANTPDADWVSENLDTIEIYRKNIVNNLRAKKDLGRSQSTLPNANSSVFGRGNDLAIRKQLDVIDKALVTLQRLQERAIVGKEVYDTIEAS